MEAVLLRPCVTKLPFAAPPPSGVVLYVVLQSQKIEEYSCLLRHHISRIYLPNQENVSSFGSMPQPSKPTLQSRINAMLSSIVPSKPSVPTPPQNPAVSVKAFPFRRSNRSQSRIPFPSPIPSPTTKLVMRDIVIKVVDIRSLPELSQPRTKK